MVLIVHLVYPDALKLMLLILTLCTLSGTACIFLLLLFCFQCCLLIAPFFFPLLIISSHPSLQIAMTPWIQMGTFQ